MGSGALDVFATPAMIALMEKTAWESVQPYLEEGSGTVGTLMNVKHVAASPVGMKITCETELTKVDGRALTFSVKAFDEAGLIGEGEHERFIVYNENSRQKPMQSWKIMLYDKDIREPLAFYLEEIYGKTESLRNR